MKRGLNIAVIAACPFPCARGTPIRILRLSEALQERGHRVEVISYHLGDSTPTQLTIHRTRRWPLYHKISAGPSYQKLAVMDPLLLKRALGVLKAGGFDLIHAHHIEGLLVGAVAGAWHKLPVVFDAHTSLRSELPDYGLGLAGWLKQNIGAGFDRFVTPRARHVVAVTPGLRQEIMASARLDPARVTTVSNGVEWAAFQNLERRERRNDRPCRLIFAGGLGPYQRIDLLLKSFRKLILRKPAVRLTMAIEHADEQLTALLRKYDLTLHIDVVVAPFEKIPQLLAESDIALNPRTRCAGVPQKLLNYMAAGKAIVSFAGSAKTIDHEVTGLIVPDEDTDGFAAACLRLIEDPALAQRLGDQACEHARLNYTWEHAAELLESVYAKVLGNPPPAALMEDQSVPADRQKRERLQTPRVESVPAERTTPSLSAR